MRPEQGGGARLGGGGGWGLAVVFAILALSTSALAYWALEQLLEPPLPPLVTERPAPPPPPPDRRVLLPASFAELPGWREDAVAEALPALLASCGTFLRRPASSPVEPREVAGTVADWHDPCRAAARLPGGDDAAARAFFERFFTPFAVANNDRRQGLFTGYYEPTLRGSRRRRPPFTVPLYRRPPDLISVDLGRFRDDLAGRRIAGRLDGTTLRPYPDRAALESGALRGRGLELVWVDDAVDAFFLHIQGSGRVELEEGGFLRVGYDGQNGHPYVAIGRELVSRGALALEEVSMQAIRAWLAAHPQERHEILHTNPSFIFFRRLEESGPVGSQGVVLTPGRSLAVDREFLPLGAPLWLDAAMPALGGATGDVETLRRLLVAQDTGGAIRGPVRGDVFWGPGDDAAERAGRMKHPGRLWLLLPAPLAARLPPPGIHPM